MVAASENAHFCRRMSVRCIARTTVGPHCAKSDGSSLVRRVWTEIVCRLRHARTFPVPSNKTKKYQLFLDMFHYTTSMYFHSSVLFMAALRNRCGHYIFVLLFLSSSSSSSLYSSPNFSGRRLDVYHTFYTRCGRSTNLERRFEMCLHFTLYFYHLLVII